jgi:hypothetical protein
VNDVFRQYVAAPALLSARVAWREKLGRRAIAKNWSAEESMEKSSMAEEELLAKQLDCKFLGAFYAELRYAAVSQVLGSAARRSCLRVAPVVRMTTAPELATYLQCLRMINGTEACQSETSETGPLSVSGSGAACEQVRSRNDWSQSGEPTWRGKPRSLFDRNDMHPVRSPQIRKAVLHLPTSTTLRGKIYTGFYLNCCTFGIGYVMPYAYLHLARAMAVPGSSLGTMPVQDIQLDRSVAGSELDKPVQVSCKRAASGETPHYALSVYCWGTQLHALSPSQSDVH